MVNFEKGIEVFVQIQKVFFLKHFFRKVGNLGEALDPSNLPRLSDVQDFLMLFQLSLCHNVLVRDSITFAPRKDVSLVGFGAYVDRII